jgi:hypothetical protein
MIERLFTLAGSLHCQQQTFAHPFLSNEIGKLRGSQAIVKRGIALIKGVNRSLIHGIFVANQRLINKETGEGRNVAAKK